MLAPPNLEHRNDAKFEHSDEDLRHGLLDCDAV
jgi:hypothetical protein